MRDQPLNRGEVSLRMRTEPAILHPADPAAQPQPARARTNVLAKAQIGHFADDANSHSHRRAHAAILA